MSVEQLGKHRWQARWRDTAGTQRARTFARKDHAVEHERAMRTAAANGGTTPINTRTTIADYADTWLAGAHHLAQGTIDTYRRELDRYIIPALGDIPLTRLRATTVDEWLAAQLAAGRAPSSVHRHYRTLHRLYNVARQRGAVSHNPLDVVTPPRIPRREMRFLTVTELDQLITATTARWSAMVAVAGWCGLRWGELLGLRRQDVDGASITVDGQMTFTANRTWSRVDPKTGAGRRTVTAPTTVAHQLATHVDTYVGSGPDAGVFRQVNGRPPIPATFHTHIWVPSLCRAGLRLTKAEAAKQDAPTLPPPPRFHDLRHTAVALAIAAGAHPKAIQARMGHSSIAVTMDRYGHLYSEHDVSVAAGLEALRQPATSPTPDEPPQHSHQTRPPPPQR